MTDVAQELLNRADLIGAWFSCISKESFHGMDSPQSMAYA